MEYLLAKSDRQLGICLRMLYDEGYKGLVVESVINAKNRMEFHVKVMADEDKMAKLNDRYQTLISQILLWRAKDLKHGLLLLSGPCYNETKGGEEHESDIAHDCSREEKRQVDDLYQRV